MTTSASPRPERFDSGLRYGVIGTGMMGVEHIENIGALPPEVGATVTALADPDEGSRERARAAVVAAGARPAGGEVAVFDNHLELLDSGLCDAVVVASPNHTHIEVLPDILTRDLHVMMEKPLCTTVADCEQVLELAVARPPELVTWMAMEYRYMPAAAELIAAVHGGAVGTPRMVAIREHRFPFLVKVGNWNRFQRNTGGTLVEKTCHFFDLMNLILRERPSRVMASGAQDVNHLDESYDGEVPDILDNAYVIVDYPSGARALLDLCMFADASAEQEELSVVGEQGKVEAKLPSNTVHLGRRGEHWIGKVETRLAADTRIAHVGLHHGSSYLEHVEFAEAVRTGGAPAVTVTDGSWAVAMGVAAHRSIDTGAPVHLDDVLSPRHRELLDANDPYRTQTPSPTSLPREIRA